jgi:hypothetical protein
MDWQSLMDDIQAPAADGATLDETKYLLGLAVIAGVMALGLLAVMFA